MKKYLIPCCILLLTASAKKLPDFFRKCDLKASDVDGCMVSAGETAIRNLGPPHPELGLPSIEPMGIPQLTIGAGKGTVALEQKYRDVKIFGFTNLKAEKVKLDLAGKTLDLKGIFPELKMTASYDFNGRVLLLPIVGTGPSTIILKNLKAQCILSFDIVEKKDRKFLKFSKVVHIDIDPEDVSFNFENLFDGNKELGDNINKVLNENSKEVFEDVRNGYATAFGEIVLGLTTSFFNKVPATDIFDNFV